MSSLLGTEQAIQQIVYTTEGVIITYLNLVIVLAVLIFKHLRRKENTIVVALAVADGMSGLGYICSGSIRLDLILQGRSNETRSAWECFWLPFNPLFLMSNFLTPVIMCCSAVDRLLAVCAITWYMKVSKKHFILIMSFCISYTVCLFFISIYMSYSARNLKPNVLCSAPLSFDAQYATIIQALRVTGAYLCTALYILMLGILRMRWSKSSLQERSYLKEQQRISYALATVIFCNCITFALPTTATLVITAVGFQNLVLSKINQWIWVVFAFNYWKMFMIYAAKHKEMRQAFWLVITCRFSPKDLKVVEPSQQSILQRKTVN